MAKKARPVCRQDCGVFLSFWLTYQSTYNGQGAAAFRSIPSIWTFITWNIFFLVCVGREWCLLLTPGLISRTQHATYLWEHPFCFVTLPPLPRVLAVRSEVIRSREIYLEEVFYSQEKELLPLICLYC